MGEVEIPKPGEGQDQDETADLPDRIAEPALRKGGLMRAFMFQREKEGQKDAVNGQQHPPQGQVRRDQRAGRGDQRQMTRKPGAPCPCAAGRQPGELGLWNAGERCAMIRHGMK